MVKDYINVSDERFLKDEGRKKRRKVPRTFDDRRYIICAGLKIVDVVMMLKDLENNENDRYKPFFFLFSYGI